MMEISRRNPEPLIDSLFKVVNGEKTGLVVVMMADELPDGQSMASFVDYSSPGLMMTDALKLSGFYIVYLGDGLKAMQAQWRANHPEEPDE